MKIMLISSLYGAQGGGSGVIASHLARGLLQAGHAVSVVTLGVSGKYAVSDENGIRIYRFRPMNLYPLEEKDTHPVWQKAIWQAVDIYNAHAARVLREILLKEKPDIVHINKMRGFSGAVWKVATDMFPGRVVQTCHDYESMSPDGLLRGRIGRMALEKRWPIRGYQLIRATLSRGISFVTAPSQFTLERIKASGLFPAAKFAVIPNTHGWSNADLEKIQSKVRGDKSIIRFLYLGRLEPEKGITTLCEAFLAVHRANSNVHLDIVGSGSLETVLRRKYANQSVITFHGMLNGDSKMDVLSNATVMVVPSQVDEVFGISAIEALAYGKPVIASRVGGLPEVIVDGETGWLIRAGDKDGLEAAIIQAVNLSHQDRIRISENCLQAARNYALEDILHRYVVVYKKANSLGER